MTDTALPKGRAVFVCAIVYRITVADAVIFAYNNALIEIENHGERVAVCA